MNEEIPKKKEVKDTAVQTKTSTDVTLELPNIKLNFESQQNLMGIFSIFLSVDKDINPQNYKSNSKKND